MSRSSWWRRNNKNIYIAEGFLVRASRTCSAKHLQDSLLGKKHKKNTKPHEVCLYASVKQHLDEWNYDFFSILATPSCTLEVVVWPSLIHRAPDGPRRMNGISSLILRIETTQSQQIPNAQPVTFYETSVEIDDSEHIEIFQRLIESQHPNNHSDIHLHKSLTIEIRRTVHNVLSIELWRLQVCKSASK